jgi:hypothetical protein
MASYTVDLTPALRNYTTEGGLDTAVVNGVSIQRTVNMVLVVDGSDRKMVGNVVDGGSFDDAVQGLGDLGFLVEA